MKIKDNYILFFVLAAPLILTVVIFIAPEKTTDINSVKSQANIDPIVFRLAAEMRSSNKLIRAQHLTKEQPCVITHPQTECSSTMLSACKAFYNDETCFIGGSRGNEIDNLCKNAANDPKLHEEKFCLTDLLTPAPIDNINL